MKVRIAASSIGRVAAIVMTAGAFLAFAAGPASAATWAPAGDAFSATTAGTGDGKFTLSWGPGYVFACNSTFSGTFSNPASSSANISTPAYSSCTYNGAAPPPGMAVEMIANGSPWSVLASSTTAAKLVPAALPASEKFHLVIKLNGGVLCKSYLPTFNYGAGSWSNATHALNMAGSVSFQNIVNGSPGGFCPGSGGGKGSGVFKTSGSYTLSNTTHPATPVTINP